MKNFYKSRKKDSYRILPLLPTFLSTGESGLGKSTLINSLFLTDIYTSSLYEDAAAKFGKTMSVSKYSFLEGLL